MESKTSLESRLRAAGRRMTPQRKLILSILDETGDHLDAEEVYRRAKQQNSNLNIATVYRTLSILKDMELIEQRYFARDHSVEYYESVNKGEHYHFTCLGCRKIIEVETPKIVQVQKEFSALTGAKFTHACVCFEGYCASCVNDEENLTL